MSRSNDPALAAFAALIRRCREEAGYANAGEFFRAHGAELMGCTAKSYQNVERGLTLPSPALVERLTTALRLGLREERLHEFSVAYVRAILGSGDFSEFAIEALTDGQSEQQSAAPSAADPTKRRLSPAEARLVRASKEAYWCFVLLNTHAEGLTVAELAEMTGFAPKALQAALEKLVGQELLRRGGGGRFAGRSHCLEEEVSGQVRDYLDAGLAREDDEVLLEHPLLLRASESELLNYFDYLKRDLADLRSLSADGDRRAAGLFVVELSLRKLLQF